MYVMISRESWTPGSREVGLISWEDRKEDIEYYIQFKRHNYEQKHNQTLVLQLMFIEGANIFLH